MSSFIIKLINGNPNTKNWKSIYRNKEHRNKMSTEYNAAIPIDQYITQPSLEKLYLVTDCH